MIDLKLKYRFYKEIFYNISPLFTIVGTTMLNSPTQLVEVEMDSIVDQRHNNNQYINSSANSLIY